MTLQVGISQQIPCSQKSKHDIIGHNIMRASKNMLNLAMLVKEEGDPRGTTFYIQYQYIVLSINWNRFCWTFTTYTKRKEIHPSRYGLSYQMARSSSSSRS